MITQACDLKRSLLKFVPSCTVLLSGVIRYVPVPDNCVHTKSGLSLLKLYGIYQINVFIQKSILVIYRLLNVEYDQDEGVILRKSGRWCSGDIIDELEACLSSFIRRWWRRSARQGAIIHQYTAHSISGPHSFTLHARLHDIKPVNMYLARMLNHTL